MPEGSDQTYPFRSHAEFIYAAGRECAGAVVAFDPRDGRWIDFVPAVTENERIWEGRQSVEGTSAEELPAWLAARRGRPVAMLGTDVRDVPADEAASQRVREQFTHLRRAKDAHELTLVRHAVTATAEGFACVPDFIRPGVTERRLEIELEAAFFRAGATRTGYATIVGSGPNSAVLHVPPSMRAVGPGEFVLIDAGAEVDRYVADVTRTFVAGTPSAFQRDLYHVVLDAEARAIARCVAGAEWKAVHLAAAADLGAGLIAMGVMRGTVDSLLEREAHTLFFPHGIGHMVGLGVRDAGGLQPGRAKDPRPSLRTLRMDLPLAPGYLVTIEPGLYFIPPLLNDPERRARYRDCVNWELVDRQQHVGGVRIEDNVLITEGAPEVLTRAIPKTLP